ncbi:murein biosynthesis integral membrane protein MurJ [Limobrevibacterium gyesilva]|uniref:Probable lipid II flippase MurJ n=1 Tax=Limobrevibacterium gyesilva TaxID=2991712 RepID=A0AA41YQG8_9PROT|nr:murein biosynthesis integral membrane protein MurJ [Limobrevibacterium gyesilva]MCW3474610.1 murein biosynthesis integral membrane protein MurJ [Limobrevibacterium gyesilva]
MLRGILTVGGWTMASRVLGFLRDILIAAMLGAGPVADAFFVANRLPNLFRRLFGEGAFNAAFVPAFSGLLAAEGQGAAQRFAEEAIAVMAFWLVGITVAAELFMPAVMTVLAPGFLDIPEKFALAVELSRITFPYMPLICLTALLSGVLNGLDRFAAAAAAPVVYNATSITFMLGLAGLVPTAGHALAWGVSASGVFQIALLFWAVRRAGMRLHVPRPRMTPQMRLLLKRMAPGLLGAGVTQLNLSVDVIIGSLLPAGTVSVLYYADRINQLPLGTIGVAVGTALLPTLSRQALAGEAAAAIATLNRALEYAITLTLPAALALFAVPGAIIGVLFGRGAFDAASVHLSAQALAAYAVGLPAFVLVKVLVPAFFARGDTAMPVKVGLVAVGLNLALNVAFMIPLQHLGPPLASSVAAWFNVVALAVILMRRGHMAVDVQLLRVVPRTLLAGLVMVAALWGLDHAVFAPLAGLSGLRWAGLAALVAGGLAAYGVAGQLVGAFDLRAMAGRVARRR